MEDPKKAPESRKRRDADRVQNTYDLLHAGTIDVAALKHLFPDWEFRDEVPTVDDFVNLPPHRGYIRIGTASNVMPLAPPRPTTPDPAKRARILARLRAPKAPDPLPTQPLAHDDDFITAAYDDDPDPDGGFGPTPPPSPRSSAGWTAAGSDIVKKLRAYWQWGYIEKQHRIHPLYREHAPKGFVVLIATNSDRRAELILQLSNPRTQPNPLPRTDMIWVASFDPHTKASAYEANWRTLKGVKRRLIES